ncbi:MAG: hypothetical protein ACK56F_32055, partial [bacterium]
MNRQPRVHPQIGHLATVRAYEGQNRIAEPRHRHRCHVGFTSGTHGGHVRQGTVPSTVGADVEQGDHGLAHRSMPAAP